MVDDSSIELPAQEPEKASEPLPLKEIKDNASHAVVQMHEFALFSGDEEGVDMVESVGAVGCQILCLRDPITKKTLLAHIDSSVNKSSDVVFMLNALFNQFSEDEMQRVQATIAGSVRPDRQVAAQLLEFEGIKPQEINSSSLAVSIKTGELYKVKDYKRSFHPNVVVEVERWQHGTFLFPAQDSRMEVDPVDIVMRYLEEDSVCPTGVRMGFDKLKMYVAELKKYRNVTVDMASLESRKNEAVEKLSSGAD